MTNKMKNSFAPPELPLVSVVIPAYNCEKYIGPCIDSVLDQDYSSMEVIVVDDGSTDNTRSVVESYGPGVKYIRQDNSGSAVARNRAIDEASGDYFAFCDSDDLWVPSHLREQITFLEKNPKFGVVTGRFSHVGSDFELENAPPIDNTVPPSLDAERSGWVYHTLFECSWYHIIASVVRREVVEATRFNPDFRRGQDYDYWLQLAHHTQIAKLQNVYAYYRKNEESISHKPHLRNYRAEIIKHNLEMFGPSSQNGGTVSPPELQSIFRQVWFEYGYELFLSAWYRRALKAFWQSCRYAPGDPASYKFMLRCLLNLYRDKSPP